MLKLGIIGAENSHSWSIAKLCNVEKAVPVRVPMIWGETRKFAGHAAEIGAIPTIVKDWREMLGQVDGVMIDHRHPAAHYEVARFFIDKRVPTFVDKPFTHTLQQAKALLTLAAKKRVPVCTFSSMPTGSSFQKFKKQVHKKGRILAVNSTGAADIKSKYGGIFFYGIHQVDAITELIGTDPKAVYVHKNLPNAVATITFRSGAVATVNALKDGNSFHWSAETANGIVNHLRSYDGNAYLVSAKILHKFLKTKKNPYSRKRMLAPIAILEAMQKSLDRGRPVNVAKF